MTKREALRQTEQERALMSLGFTRDEAEALRRISMTLHNWYERECGDGNGAIERDEQTGKTYWLNSQSGRRTPIADRETGAVKRLDAIIAARNARAVASAAVRTSFLTSQAICERYGLPFEQPGSSRTALGYYLQTDPRGAALYIIRPGDVPDGGNVESYYDRGVCVY